MFAVKATYYGLVKGIVRIYCYIWDCPLLWQYGPKELNY